MAERVWILGIPVDRVTLGEAAARVMAFARDGRGRHVVTANPELVMEARRDPALRAALLGADLVVADGIGLVWAASLLGPGLPQRVPGVDLVWEVLRLGAREGLRVFFLGGAPGVAEEAARCAAAAHPGLVVAGCQHGYFAPGEEERVLARIAQACPQLLLVALGAPRQERWIARHRRDLGGVVAIGVGGTLDVFAGRRRRAPAWLQHLGLEWAYRLVREPRRARRMLALPRFALRVAGARRTVRTGGRERP